MHTNILDKNIHQFMQFNIHTRHKSSYQLNKSKLKIRGFMHLSKQKIKIFKKKHENLDIKDHLHALHFMNIFVFI